MENSPKHENKERPPEYLEAVVADVREARRSCKEHPDSPSCNCDLLHDRLCHTEIGDIFEKYENHNTLTFQDIENSIELVLTRIKEDTEAGLLEQDDMQEVTSKALLLKERSKEIARATRSYVRTISQYHEIKRQQIRLDQAEFAEKMQDIDRRRRSFHNGLIESLTVYTRVIRELSDYGLLEDVELVMWNSGESFDLPKDKPAVAIFSPQVLNERELVKDWAITANMHATLQDIQKIQEEAKRDVNT